MEKSAALQAMIQNATRKPKYLAQNLLYKRLSDGQGWGLLV